MGEEGRSHPTLADAVQEADGEANESDVHRWWRAVAQRSGGSGDTGIWLGAGAAACLSLGRVPRRAAWAWREPVRMGSTPAMVFMLRRAGEPSWSVSGGIDW